MFAPQLPVPKNSACRASGSVFLAIASICTLVSGVNSRASSTFSSRCATVSQPILTVLNGCDRVNYIACLMSNTSALSPALPIRCCSASASRPLESFRAPESSFRLSPTACPLPSGAVSVQNCADDIDRPRSTPPNFRQAGIPGKHCISTPGSAGHFPFPLHLTRGQLR